jgi:hypothetical protein
MSLLALAGTNSATGGYEIDNSIKTQANADNEWFYRSSPTIGNKRTFTFSFWIKRTQLTGYQADPYLMSQGTNARFHFAGDTLRFMFDGGTTELEAPAKLRDTSAWYHIVLAVDTTQSTAANRVKAYLNGQDYDWNNTKYPTQNQESSWMSGTNMYFNTRDGDGSYDNSGYWSEVVVVDGQQLDPTSFGEYDEDSGIWKPKDLSGLTFGSEGFYYKFDNASSLGEDSSGNGNDATLNNITAADQATDTPTNNFATLNPLIYDINSVDDESYICFNGATSIAASKNAYAQNYATIGLNIASGGKWYFEWTATSTANGSSSEGLCGLAFDTQWDAGLNSTGVYNAGYAYYAAGFGHGEGYGANVVNGLLIDLDNNKVKWYRNGTLHITMPDDGGSTMQTSGYAFPYIAPYGSGYTINVNLGGFTAQAISSANTDPNGYGSFEYPTQGGYAICTKNLEEYG